VSMMNKANLPNRWIRWTERLLLVVGMTALGLAGKVILEAKITQAYQTYCLEQALRHKPSSLTGFLAYSLGHHQEKGSQDQVFTLPTGTIGPETTVPAETKIGTGSAIGLLEVPRLGLSVIVLEGTDEHTLQLGAGHIENTALPGELGNLGIAGHRDTFFRPLKDIRQNDRITMTTLSGSFDYRVQCTQIVKPTDTRVLAPSSSLSLTLVTCYPFYFVGAAPERFIVRAIETGRTLPSVVL
jgi:LPXTG-site transpeptidase (sortase) family protein